MNYKQLSISLAISLGIGGLSGLITMMGMKSFKNANKPPLTPPDFLFPIVLTILLWLLIILMIKWVTFAAYLNIGLAECRSGIEI
ncbi:tryptophan-rich sensory protein [Ruminococcus sp.]|uniref:tryptophan-rich sensory protein n=1 Tax=Ruminococcus sp. TaxID=41978 RepID=UPI003520F67C